MNTYTLSEIQNDTSFIGKCVRRVTQGIVNCNILIISRKNLLENVKIENNSPNSCNKYEKEAAYYYQTKGYRVIRLDHWATCSVGRNEHLFKEAAKLGDLLRSIFSREDYSKFIYRPKYHDKTISLSSIYPKNYPLSVYPPDFLVINKSNLKWKFVEIKSPNDRIHFRQANWYINLLPANWEYEIFASLNKEFDDIYIKNNLPRKRVGFDELYKKEKRKVDKYNKRVISILNKFFFRFINS